MAKVKLNANRVAADLLQTAQNTLFGMFICC